MSIIDTKGIKETIDPAILPRAAGGDIELTRERLAQALLVNGRAYLRHQLAVAIRQRRILVRRQMRCAVRDQFGLRNLSR